MTYDYTRVIGIPYFPDSAVVCRKYYFVINCQSQKSTRISLAMALYIWFALTIVITIYRM